MKVETTTVHSAGGVVLRVGVEGLCVLLIATHERTRWSLPKGRIEPGEEARAAALREVAEETGIQARILAPLDTVEYWFYASRRHRLHKYVEYFLMAYEAGHLVPQVQEVDAVRWWPLSVALSQVSYPNDRCLIQKAHALWQAGR